MDQNNDLIDLSEIQDDGEYKNVVYFEVGSHGGWKLVRGWVVALGFREREYGFSSLFSRYNKR